MSTDLIEVARCRADHPSCNDPALIHRLCDALEVQREVSAKTQEQFMEAYHIGMKYATRMHMAERVANSCFLNGIYSVLDKDALNAYNIAKARRQKGETNERVRG